MSERRFNLIVVAAVLAVLVAATVAILLMFSVAGLIGSLPI